MNVEPEVIFGAPGCGKTTYLMDVLQKELKDYAPQRIAFVSFTKKGAKQGLEKALEKFNYTEQDFPYFRTLHSICFRELRMSRYDMLTKKDYKVFSAAMNMNFIGYYTEEFFHNDDRYLYLYFLKHNNYEMYKKIRDATEVNVDTLAHVARNYNSYKLKFKKYDFTDLLKDTIKKGIEVPVDVAIIDEAQDLTTLQWEVVQQLFKNVKKMYIAGDDDQAIYEWTGADVNYFLNIKGKRTILDKSWRLQSNLLDFTKKISAMIQQRVDKKFEPVAEGGNINYYNSIDNFKFNPKETYYCLSRNNYFLKEYASELRRQTLQYDMKGVPSVNQEIVTAINNFDDYKKGNLNDKDALFVSKHLKKDVGPLDKLTWFEAIQLSTNEAIYYRHLISKKAKIIEPKIHINTIHGVKGGEADNVILLMDVTKTVYQHLYALSDSELRCLYVACTRAKKNLHIVHEKTRHSYKDLFKELTHDNNL